MPGFGTEPFGSAPYGLGTPATAAPIEGAIFADPVTGETHGGRLIDPKTKDYVYKDGRAVGMGNVKQRVLLAVSTEKGSSAMRELGHTLKRIERISANILYEVRAILLAAVRHIVAEGLMEVVNITVQKGGTGQVFARMQWRDLSTGADETTDVL